VFLKATLRPLISLSPHRPDTNSRSRCRGTTVRIAFLLSFFLFLRLSFPCPLPSCPFTLPLFPFYLDYASTWIDNSFFVAQSSLSFTIYSGKAVRCAPVRRNVLVDAALLRRSSRCPCCPPRFRDAVVGWRQTRHQAVSAQGIPRPSWNLEGNVGAPDRKPGVGLTARRLRTQSHQWSFASLSTGLGRSAGRAMDGR
jgi:hypothetical protein